MCVPAASGSMSCRGPDGAEYPNHSVFQEVVPGERLVYSHGGFKKGGSAVSFESTWTFEALDARTTRVTVRMVFATAEERDRVAREFGAIQGLSQTLSRLRERLARAEAGPGEVFVIAREFDAPRELVFRAWTDPEMLAQWWGPKGCHSKTAHVRPASPKASVITPCSCRTAGRCSANGSSARSSPRNGWSWFNSFADEKGNIVRHPFVANWPLELLTTITFAGQKREDDGDRALGTDPCDRGGAHCVHEESRIDVEGLVGYLRTVCRLHLETLKPNHQ